MLVIKWAGHRDEGVPAAQSPSHPALGQGRAAGAPEHFSYCCFLPGTKVGTPKAGTQGTPKAGVQGTPKIGIQGTPQVWNPRNSQGWNPRDPPGWDPRDPQGWNPRDSPGWDSRDPGAPAQCQNLPLTACRGHSSSNEDKCSQCHVLLLESFSISDMKQHFACRRSQRGAGESWSCRGFH